MYTVDPERTDGTESMFEGNNGCLSERLRLQHQETQERTVGTATHKSLPTV